MGDFLFLLFALLCLFCNFISFCNNVFETKTAEKARRKRNRHFSPARRLLLLVGYPIWRRIGYFWCLSVIALNVISQIGVWIFADFSNTVFAQVVVWITLFSLFVSYGIATIQSFLFRFLDSKSKWGKIGYFLLIAFVFITVCSSVILLVFAVV